MKQVTFSRAMPPFGAGDKRLVPDEVAKRLKAEGAISASETWPPEPASAARAPERPRRPTLKINRPAAAPSELDLRVAR